MSLGPACKEEKATQFSLGYDPPIGNQQQMLLYWSSYCGMNQRENPVTELALTSMQRNWGSVKWVGIRSSNKLKMKEMVKEEHGYWSAWWLFEVRTVSSSGSAVNLPSSKSLASSVACLHLLLHEEDYLVETGVRIQWCPWCLWYGIHTWESSHSQLWSLYLLVYYVLRVLGLKPRVLHR